LTLFSYDQYKFGYATDSGITYHTKLVILLEMAENLSHKNVIENVLQESKRV